MATPTSLVEVLAPVEQEGTKAAVKMWLKQVGDTVVEGEPCWNSRPTRWPWK